MFILDTGASLWGIGGVLSQEKDGTEMVIAYTSKTLPGRQHQNADALSRKPNSKYQNHSCHDCFPALKSDKVLGKDKDSTDSTSKTDPVQVTYGTFLPLTSSSCPVPGHSDRKPGPHSGVGETQGQEGPFSSHISPIIDTPNVVDLNEPHWIPSWNPEELRQMQKEEKISEADPGIQTSG